MVTAAYRSFGIEAIAGQDFEAVSGMLVIAPGETSKNIPVQVSGDVDSEGDERFGIVLEDPTNASIAASWAPVDWFAQGTIINDDIPILTVSAGYWNEGITHHAPVGSTLKHTQPITVDYRTVDGTAIARGSRFGSPLNPLQEGCLNVVRVLVSRRGSLNPISEHRSGYQSPLRDHFRAADSLTLGRSRSGRVRLMCSSQPPFWRCP
ncbi:MAG: hypothetical protein ACI8XO_001041 [Verrucomicrobiales bacterium]|jgi:hypothetical protein